MIFSNIASVTALAATVAATLSTYQPKRRAPAEFDWETLTPSRELEFSRCYEEYECARLIVPLDWTERNAEKRQGGRTMTLALTRLTANSTDGTAYGGTVIVNPGGPGDSGTVEMLKNGHYLRDLVATERMHFDVLSFDPRGMGFSTPNVDCFAGEEASRTLYSAHSLGMEVGGVRGDDRDEVVAAQRAAARAHGAKCNVPGEDGYVVQEYVGTPSVARDMLLMVDELEKLRVREAKGKKNRRDQGVQKTLGHADNEGGEDKLPRLLYFGTSYGTMLGNTFISLFPGRVKRMILDGNVVPEDYTSGNWAVNIADTSKVISYFYDACFDAKSACALYDPKADKSPAALREKVADLATRLTEEPLAIAGKNLAPSILTGSVVQAIFADALYDPIGGFSKLASTLADAVAGNYTALIAAAGVQLRPDEAACENGGRASIAEYRWQTEANMAVRCGDGPDQRNTTLAAWRAQLKQARELSPEWADLWMSVECLEWPVRPNWRFEGPFGSPEAEQAGGKQHQADGRPSAPVLFLASRFDPATPMGSSVTAAKAHAGSGLLVQNTYGHCATLSAPSECTKEMVGRYMETGRLPEKGAECEGACMPFEECPYLRMVLPR
ncbi:Peptidase S33 tripeptidyl aminopeptidase-lik [Akanthomyces lecanii RCEF 1005]|uniref:Peptidase S33 tripeptidyl aminopeptidase-lik n=1 Tax=Akanthomyces lecanii RCEF 1005 TaxID=1081108 RepID=A0A168F197_CORDF|nr:Peptidase S33 tripeptidyl aminopeptidase-lik [Akanthomyces lecanii RCEF 1005]